jgi:hypothetical protein
MCSATPANRRARIYQFIDEIRQAFREAGLAPTGGGTVKYAADDLDLFHVVAVPKLPESGGLALCAARRARTSGMATSTYGSLIPRLPASLAPLPGTSTTVLGLIDQRCPGPHPRMDASAGTGIWRRP